MIVYALLWVKGTTTITIIMVKITVRTTVRTTARTTARITRVEEVRVEEVRVEGAKMAGAMAEASFQTDSLLVALVDAFLSSREHSLLEQV